MDLYHPVTVIGHLTPAKGQVTAAFSDGDMALQMSYHIKAKNVERL